MKNAANDIVPAASIGCATMKVSGRPWPDTPSTPTKALYEGTLPDIASLLI